MKQATQSPHEAMDKRIRDLLAENDNLQSRIERNKEIIKELRAIKAITADGDVEPAPEEAGDQDLKLMLPSIWPAVQLALRSQARGLSQDDIFLLIKDKFRTRVKTYKSQKNILYQTLRARVKTGELIYDDEKQIYQLNQSVSNNGIVDRGSEIQREEWKREPASVFAL